MAESSFKDGGLRLASEEMSFLAQIARDSGHRRSTWLRVLAELVGEGLAPGCVAAGARFYRRRTIDAETLRDLAKDGFVFEADEHGLIAVVASLAVDHPKPPAKLTRDDISVGMIGKRVRVEDGKRALEGVLVAISAPEQGIIGPRTVHVNVEGWEMALRPDATIEVLE